MNKSLGEMTPDERKAAIARAVRAFQSELEQAAPAIGAILEDEDEQESQNERPS